jgi:hypothetical protein
MPEKEDIGCRAMEKTYSELKKHRIDCCPHCMKDKKNTALIRTTHGKFDVCCTHEAYFLKHCA